MGPRFAIIAFGLLMAGRVVADSVAVVDFEKQILPIFEHKCFGCHSSEIKKPKAGLKLDDAVSIKSAAGPDGVIVPGKPDESELLRVLELPQGDDDVMPPTKEASPLTKAQVQMVRDWIAQGAATGKWEKHERVVLEKIVVPAEEARNPKQAAARIDALLDAALAKQGIQPPPMASEDTFMRRVYLDLAGRNPTFEEARTHLQSRDPGKRSKLIDRLLESEGYVSRHFNYWADALRAKSALSDDGGGPSGAGYMAWLKASLRENKRYDQLVRELLIARGRLYETPQTGFYLRDSQNRLAGVENASGLFLGEQIGCAMCHDHPYDTWTRKDFYEFAAFMLGVNAHTDKKTIFQHIDGELIEKQTSEIKHVARMRELEKQGKVVPGSDRGPDGRAATAEMGDGMMSSRPGADGASLFRDQELREQLIKEVGGVDFGLMTYTIPNYGVGRRINSPERPRVGLPKDYQYGDGKPGEWVVPSVLFGETPPLEGRNPTEVLAEWMTSPENPRFALVAANRLWNKTFGWSVSGPAADIIEPEKGSAPQLARYLEALFRATGCDLKQFLRILSHTRAYQRSAVVGEANDAGGRIFAAPLVRRLSAEQVWDSLVALVDPALDERIEKGPVRDKFLDAVRNAATTEDYWRLMLGELEERKAKGETFLTQQNRIREVKNAGFDGAALRRASELSQPSSDGHFLRIFGQSNRLLMDNAWQNPTVPQALTLMNGPLFQMITRPDSAFNRSLDAINTVEGRCSAVFLSILGRIPSVEEVRFALSEIQDGEQMRYEDLAWALINSRGFLFQH